MNYKLIGIILVISGCALFGFHIASNHKKDMRSMRQLITALEQMSCELRFKVTALPELCRFLASGTNGCIHTYFLNLSQELENQTYANAETCGLAVLDSRRDIPPETREVLTTFAQSLGKYSLEGQLRELDYVQQLCAEKMKYLTTNTEMKTRNTQTLAVCIGVAIVIILA